MDNGPTAYSEDGRRGHGPSNTGGPKKTEKNKRTYCCLESPEKMQSCRNLDFNPINPISDF